MTDFESRLRATLVDRAKDAPPGEPLAERILTEVSAPVPVLRPRRGWRTWTMPLMAAATVAGVTVAALSLSHLGTSASPKQAPLTHNHSVSPSPLASRIQTPSATKSPTNKTHATKSTQPVGPPVNADPNGVTGFRLADLSFYRSKDGWAIGTSRCLSGSGRCTALFRMTDGAHWTSLGNSLPFTVSDTDCSDCVDHIRFATPSTGYAYGPGALFMTTDGGLNWKQQPGRGAEALETFNNNVIRLVSNHSGCPGPCSVYAETAAIGSPVWTKDSLPDTVTTFGYGAALSRALIATYALAEPSPAGGNPDPADSLYVSTDNGASWTRKPAPCASTGSQYTLAIAAGETVSAVCMTTSNHGRKIESYVATSNNEGSGFTRLRGSTFAGDLSQGLFAGDPNTELLAVGPHGLIRYSSDTKRWTRVDGVTGRPSFVGFESQTLGRVVTDGGRIVWTTKDGGQTWSPYRFA